MQVGDKVKTNQAYYELFGRRTYGVVEEDTTDLIPSFDTLAVRVTYQEGNVIPEQLGKVVLMVKEDLELD